MGIKDLLRFMKPYIEPIHIKNYAGKRVGIDAYSWLHKGAYSCSMEICLDLSGDKKLRYLQYFMHRIKLLQYYKIIPVVVFDGGNLPCKSATEEDRHKRRKTNLDLAMAKYKEGNITAAAELFQRAVSITPIMAHNVIQILKSENIEFLVAPYEADAQLAYLSSIDAEEGGIAAVITEDSDLLAYGCKSVIFKMDKDGNGEAIIMDSIFDSSIQKPSFRNLNIELFTGMCVLAGCDFLPSVPGIGIVKAHALISKYRNIERVLAILKIEKGNQMPDQYIESFREALAVFEHAQIYDARMKMLRHMTPLPETLLKTFNGKLNFLGPNIPPSTTVDIAEGKLNPITMKVFDDKPVLKHQCNKNNNFVGSPRKRICAPLIETTEENCFAVLSSCETITTSETNTKKRSTIKEWNHLTEASSLARLAFQQDNKITLQNLVFPTEYMSMKTPDNNPFKKRAANEGQLPPEIQITSEHTEQYSEVTEVEDDNVVCLTRDSQDSVTTNTIKNSDVDKTAGVVCQNLEMQEKMDFKVIESINVAQTTSRGKKLKRISIKSENSGKNSSILNFFSRIS